MARGQIIADTTRLDSTAQSVITLADNYHQEYFALFSSVQQLQSTWEGVDNKAFTEQIEGFRDDFQRMEQLMRDYAEFLKKTAATYRQAQSEIVNAAQTLPQGS